MIIVYNIQDFLQDKVGKDKLKRKDFAEKSGIPYSTVNKIINANRLNPKFENVIKIAKYFDCTIDEVIGREKFLKKLEKYKFNDISLDEINNNLRNFINDKLKEKNLTISELSKKIGISEKLITNFLDSPNESLSSVAIFVLADYFEISIDEMIGRVSQSNQESQQTTEKDKFKPA